MLGYEKTVSYLILPTLGHLGLVENPTIYFKIQNVMSHALGKFLKIKTLAIEGLKVNDVKSKFICLHCPSLFS